VTFTGVTNFVQFPTNVQFGAITTSVGSVSITGSGLVTFNVGTLTNNASVVQSIMVTNVTLGMATNTASLTSIESGLEPNLANNVALVVANTSNFPLLNISRSGGNVIVYWSTNATAAGFVLQAKPNLATNVAWVNVTNVPVTIGNQSYVTNSLSSGPIRNYRLFK
jgi:hypothetical protein